jgi:hypothetical protein
MTSITLWALESDYDKEVVKCLADKLNNYNKLDNIFIRTVGKNAIPKQLKVKGLKDPDAAIKRAVELYLKQDRCVIFIIDTDGSMSSHQRRKEPNSLINQVERVIKSFDGRVYCAYAVHEIEAWLLIDCEGIFCYFAGRRKQYKENCREKIIEKQEVMRLIKKYQRGNTESIIEAESGGSGVKEYLIKFSKEILQTLNPKIPMKNIDDEEYREALSPQIAKHIEINKKTLGRNASLRRLGELMDQCGRQKSSDGYEQ